MLICFISFQICRTNKKNTDVVDDQEMVTVPFPTRSEHIDVEPSTSSSSDLQPMPSRKSHRKGKGKESEVQSVHDVRFVGDYIKK